MENKMKTELKKRIIENNKKIELYKSKIDIYNENTLQNRIQIFLNLIVFINPVVMGLLAILKVPSLFLISPMVSLPIMSSCISLLLSTMIEAKYIKNTKKELNKVTSSKKQVDIMNEMLELDLEVAKCESREQAMQQALINIDNGFYASTIDKNEENVQEDLNKKQEELDILSTKKFIKDNFGAVTNKKERKKESLWNSMYLGNIITTSIAVPLMIINFFARYPLPLGISNYLYSFITVVTPAVLSSLVALPFISKYNYSSKCALDKINYKLGQSKFDFNRDYDYELENKIVEVTKLETMLCKNKSASKPINHSNNSGLEVNNSYDYTKNDECKIKVKRK